MASEISLRIWSELTPVELWARLIAAVGKWGAIDGAWQGLRMADERLHPAFELRGDVTPEVLQDHVTKLAQADQCFKTGIAFRCWRNEHREPKLGHQRLGVDVWGTTWRLERDRRIEGHACVWIANVGHYLPSKTATSSVWNDRAEQNNDALMQLLFLVIDEVAPTKMTLASESGLPLPLNVHAVWHRDRAGFLTDIALIRDLYLQGLPAYHLPPLQADSTPNDTAALHEWRSPEERHHIWEWLQWVHVNGGFPTMTDVDRELASGQCYFYDHRGGVLLLASPFLFEAFLDRFFLGVMER